jgi:hypothetical protein
MGQEPTGYDEALAGALDESEESDGLRGRLADGTATDEDRVQARHSLDGPARRRFELAHPVQPQARDLEVEAEEVECPIEDLGSAKRWKPHAKALRERLRAAAEGAPAEQPTVVTLRVRLTPND